MTRLEALAEFVNLQIAGTGFEADSAAYRLAEAAGLPLVQVPLAGKDQGDLFGPTLYAVPADWWERFPLALGGAPPPDALDEGDDGMGSAWAWDEHHVLTGCPRGALCMISRDEWAAGYRFCKGC